MNRWCPPQGRRGPSASQNIQAFGAPGQATYTPSNGMTFALVECWGGGGGGGAALPIAPYTAMGGGGGGSGGYSRRMVSADLVRGGVVMTIGSQGAGATIAGGTDGGAGGATSFGALCLANGGEGGKSAGDTATGVSSGYGGEPGGFGIGDITWTGNAGQSGGFSLSGEEVAVYGGMGGAAPAGGGVMAQANTLAGTNVVTNGANVSSYSAGGGGGASANLGLAAAGGTGGGGLIVITETCLGPFSVRHPKGCQCGCGPGWWGTGWDSFEAAGVDPASMMEFEDD